MAKREAQNLADLEALEKLIQSILQPHTLDSVLLGIWNKANPGGFPEPFMVAGTVLFALRHCAPAFGSTRTAPALNWRTLSPIVDLVTKYLLTDPVGFDDTVPNSTLSIFLRIVGNQFPYAVDPFGQHARSLMLYRDIPLAIAGQKHVPTFDFPAAFERVNGVSVQDFADVGLVAFAAAHGNMALDRGYFQKARDQGILLPDEEAVAAVLNHLAADPGTFKEKYTKYKQEDRRFGIYDFNPLFVFPFIRPWRLKKRTLAAQYRMTAPLPNMILWRISNGIYYQMQDHYKEDFLPYFGRVFETYVGEVLRHCVSPEMLLSEHDIRTAYSAKAGKAPDWVVIYDNTAILIECKATRLSQLALVTGKEEAIKSSLGKVKEGLRQLYEFTRACQSGQVRHPALQKCTAFCPVILTFESLLLSNSGPFREFLNGMVDDDVKALPWLILSLDDLEQLQPHLSAGVAMPELFSQLRDRRFNDVLEEAHQQTGCTYQDTFLYQKDKETYERLGVNHKGI